MGERKVLTRDYLKEFADQISESGVEMPDNTVIRFNVPREHYKEFWKNEVSDKKELQYDTPQVVRFNFENGISVEVASQGY